MNEKIKQLVEQAWIADGLEINPNYKKSTTTEYLLKNMEGFHEKFVELIVLECLANVWYTREEAIDGNISQVIKDRIKQHFGADNEHP